MLDQLVAGGFLVFLPGLDQFLHPGIARGERLKGGFGLAVDVGGIRGGDDGEFKGFVLLAVLVVFPVGGEFLRVQEAQASEVAVRVLFRSGGAENENAGNGGEGFLQGVVEGAGAGFVVRNGFSTVDDDHVQFGRSGEMGWLAFEGLEGAREPGRFLGDEGIEGRWGWFLRGSFFWGLFGNWLGRRDEVLGSEARKFESKPALEFQFHPSQLCLWGEQQHPAGIAGKMNAL